MTGKTRSKMFAESKRQRLRHLFAEGISIAKAARTCGVSYKHAKLIAMQDAPHLLPAHKGGVRP